MSRKSLVLLACVACCAVPLLPVMLGSSSLILALTNVRGDSLICLIPIVVIGIAWFKSSQRRSQCCETPSPDCQATRCGVITSKETGRARN